jgi:hypothetical protein
MNMGYHQTHKTLIKCGSHEIQVINSSDRNQDIVTIPKILWDKSINSHNSEQNWLYKKKWIKVKNISLCPNVISNKTLIWKIISSKIIVPIEYWYESQETKSRLSLNNWKSCKNKQNSNMNLNG